MAIRVIARLSLVAAGSAALCSAVAAGVIEGTVTFPSQFAPSMTVYAADLDNSRVNFTQLARGQVNFSLDVASGRYWVFLAPNEPGSPDVYGAFTHYSMCVRQRADPCSDHSLVGISVSVKSPRAAVVIDDWYLTDDVAEQIDRMRGLASAVHDEPLGAPRFSEYPSESPIASPLPAVDFSAGELSEDDRQIVQHTLAGGPNFAGHMTAALTHCGTGCSRILLLDWRTGQLLSPAELNEIQDDLPCRGREAHLFRSDSRLLSITRTRGAQVVTQYYVWNQKNAVLVPAGEYHRTAQTFCAIAAR